MHQPNCLNCETPLQGEEKFCPTCGQKTDTHRFTWTHFFHEAWHAITHTDKGILNLLKGLATQPGTVVKEYVDGKHKKYFNPITFMLLCLGLFVAANSIIKPFIEFPQPDPKVIAQLKTEQEKKMYIGFFERSAVAIKFQQQHPNIVAMIGLPIEAFIFWLFFRRRGRNFVEIIIAIIFLGGFANLVFTFTLGPLLSVAKNTPYYIWIMPLVFICMASYSAWGMKGFLTNPHPIAYWKPFFVGILYYIIWISLVAVFFVWYVMRDQSAEMIKRIFEK